MKPTSASASSPKAGSMVELTPKVGRQEKDNDVLMYVKIAEKSGKLEAHLRGVGTTSVFQKVRNVLLGRAPASDADVRNLFIQRGMTQEQAEAAMSHIEMIGGHYSAASVKTALTEFENSHQPVKAQPPASDGKFLAKDQCGDREFELKSALQTPIEDYKG